VAEKGSYFSRLTTKFLEIVAAGIATAVSGYLVAHLSGYWSAPGPQPAAVQIAPAAIGTTGWQNPASPPPVVAAPQAPVVVTAPNVQTTGSAGAAAPLARKHAEPAAADNKPRETVETKRVSPESKARDAESVEAQIRAALAKVDASQPPPVETPPTVVTPAIPAPSKPAATATPAVAAVPPVPPAVVTPPAAALAPAPLGSVEIKSQPVAAVDPSAPAPAPVVQADAQDKDKGFLATLKHLPDLLRPAPAASEPPRPPLPVGSDQ
jgi:hypothetical protein